MEKWRMKILYPMSQALLHLRNSVSYLQDPEKYGISPYSADKKNKIYAY